MSRSNILWLIFAAIMVTCVGSALLLPFVTKTLHIDRRTGDLLFEARLFGVSVRHRMYNRLDLGAHGKLTAIESPLLLEKSSMRFPWSAWVVEEEGAEFSDGASINSLWNSLFRAPREKLKEGAFHADFINSIFVERLGVWNAAVPGENAKAAAHQAWEEDLQFFGRK